MKQMLPNGPASPATNRQQQNIIRNNYAFVGIMQGNTHVSETRMRLLQQHLQNAEQVKELASCDATYKSEYKHYCNWVKRNPDFGIVEAPFVWPILVDNYFNVVVAERKGTKSTISRIPNALDFFWTKVESSDRIRLEMMGKILPEMGKLADREMVRGGIDLQQTRHELQGSSNPGSDPHKGLKDIIPENDLLRAMRYIYTDNQWGPLAIHFLYGQNGAIRGASNHNLKYCDLKYSNGFVNEPGESALLVIIRKGKVHKDRHEQDKQVCYWRHKRYCLCSVFATAAYVVWNLARDFGIHFKHEDKKKRAPWWDTDLTDWNHYTSKYIFQSLSIYREPYY